MGKGAQLKSGNARDGRIVEIWEENEFVRRRKDSVQFVVQITVARDSRQDPAKSLLSQAPLKVQRKMKKTKRGAEGCSRVELKNRK
jgi:hypothetical protein